MKRFIALMTCAVSLGAAAQSTVVYPFNPDANSDGFVGVSDILEGVATYDNFFTPGEILVGDTALADWIYMLSATLQGQQELIDSLMNGSQTTAPTGNFGHFYQSFDFPQGRGGESLILYLEGEEEFQVPQGYNFYVYMTKHFGCSNEGIADFYGGYIDGVQIHSTTPNGFSHLGYASGTTIKQVGCSSYVLYGFLMPAVEWVNYELVSLGPGDSMTIPEGKHFLAKTFEGDHSQLSFSVTPEPPGLLYSEIDSPYSTGGSHLWSGIVTNNSIADCWIYGYTFDGALYGSLSSTSQGDGLSNSDDAVGGLGPCQGVFTINYHDHDYELTEIGNQCWFAENLRYLPFVGPSTELSTKISVNGYGGFDVEEAKNTEAYIDYGAWYEANIWEINEVQLCPTGWSVPTVAQIETLVNEVGGESGPLKTPGWSEIGTSDWLYPNYGATNSTGFSGTPGGYGEYPPDGTTMRIAVSTWPFNGVWGHFEINSNGLWNWNGHYGDVNVSIRCIKDSQ